MGGTKTCPRKFNYNTGDYFPTLRERHPGGSWGLYSTGVHPRTLHFTTPSTLGSSHCAPLNNIFAGYSNIQPKRYLSPSGKVTSLNSPPTPSSSPAEFRFRQQLKLDFPNGFKIIPTDGSHLLCGPRALHHSIRAQLSHLIRVLPQKSFGK